MAVSGGEEKEEMEFFVISWEWLGLRSKEF